MTLTSSILRDTIVQVLKHCKSSLITVMIIFPLCGFSQNWKKTNVRDEFGDLTGVKEFKIKTIGKFNNSAQVGSRAILYVSFRFHKSKDFKDITMSLYFRVSEYRNNPADFGREYEELQVVLKKSDNEVLRSQIMTSGYSDDDRFALHYYIDPLPKIKERTKKVDADENTYYLIKPTYDIDSKIVEEIVFGKDKIRLNIYSETASYFFQFNSLGKYNSSALIDFEKEHQKTKLYSQMLLEKREVEKRKSEVEKREKEKTILDLFNKLDRSDLDDYDFKKVKRKLHNLEFSELKNIGSLKIDLVESGNSFVLFRNYGRVSVFKIMKDGTKTEWIPNLTINKDSNFKKIFFQKLKKSIGEIDNYNSYKIDNLFSDKYGGAEIKARLKKVLFREFHTLLREPQQIKSIALDFNFYYRRGGNVQYLMYIGDRLKLGNFILSTVSSEFKGKSFLKENKFEKSEYFAF